MIGQNVKTYKDLTDLHLIRDPALQFQFKFGKTCLTTCDTDNRVKVIYGIKASVIPISFRAITPMPIDLIITRTSENTKF